MTSSGVHANSPAGPDLLGVGAPARANCLRSRRKRDTPPALVRHGQCDHRRARPARREQKPIRPLCSAYRDMSRSQFYMSRSQFFRVDVRSWPRRYGLEESRRWCDDRGCRWPKTAGPRDPVDPGPRRPGTPPPTIWVVSMSNISDATLVMRPDELRLARELSVER